MTKKYAPGQNPNSLANLQHEGRPKHYDEAKKKREVSVTQTGWAGCKQVAAAAGCRGVSQLLERLGRGELIVIAPDEEE